MNKSINERQIDKMTNIGNEQIFWSKSHSGILQRGFDLTKEFAS
jgi:hypothetical protein